MSSDHVDSMSLAFDYVNRYEDNDVADVEMKNKTDHPLVKRLWDYPGFVDYATLRYRTEHRATTLLIEEKRARKGSGIAGALVPKPLIFNRNAPQRIGNILIPKPLEPGEKPNPGYSLVGSARSGLLHPGGGLGGRIGPEVDIMRRRCPAGYEHGGRFTNRALGNCGARLFDIFDGPGGASVIGSLADAAGGPDRGGPAGAVSIGRVIGEGRYLNSPVISRKPQIPDMQKPNRTLQDDHVKTITRRLGDSAAKEDALFVRADGIVTAPKAAFAKIAKNRNNKEVVDGVAVLRAPDVNKIGGDEVSLLGSGARSIIYALPGNKGQITLSRNADMSSTDAGAMRRRLGMLRRMPDKTGPEVLRSLADSTSSISYSEVFEGIENPTQLVRIGVDGQSKTTKTVPRWVYEVYFAPNAPGNGKKTTSWSIIDSEVA